MMIDRTPFGDQQLITSLGLTAHGQKLVLGLRQGATENATVVKQLQADLQDRGVDFEVPRLYVLDGGKALFAGARHDAGKAAIVQRCQVHESRNTIATCRKNIRGMSVRDYIALTTCANMPTPGGPWICSTAIFWS